MILKRAKTSLISAALASTLLFGATNANSMIVGAAVQARGTFFTGLVLLFIIPPLGLILDQDSANKDVKKKLPWMGSSEEKQVNKLITNKLQAVQQEVGQQTRRTNDKNRQKQQAKKVLKQQQVKIIQQDSKKMYQFKLQEQEVRQIFADQDYSQQQVQQAVQQLCK